MNATDCARATEPYSRTVRHKTRLKVTARRLTCRSCGTSANIATILSRAYHQYEFGGRGALRHRSQLTSNALPLDPPPDPAASATPFSDRYCQGGSVEVSSSHGRFSRAGPPDRER